VGSGKPRLLSVAQRADASRRNPLVARLVDRLRALFGDHDTNGDRMIDCEELARALRTYNVYVSPEQAYYTMIHYKHVHGGDVADFPPYAPDEPAARDLEFSFKEFVDLITGGHLEELVVQEITEPSWFFDKPRSLQCDLLCRVLFPPLSALVLTLCLVLPAHAPAKH